MSAAAASLRESPRTLPAAVRVFTRFWSPRILAALAAVAWTARLALGGFSWADAVVVLVLLAFWPLQEWLIHVFVLHYRPVTLFGREIDFAVPRSHRAHHRDPWRLDLVFIPVHVFAYAPLFVVALFWLLTPSWPVALTGIAAYFTLALRYEWVHYIVHTRYVPRTAHGRALWRSHRLHHCKNEHYWFGVSMLGGDRLLRTRREPGEVPLSDTCRSLGYEDDLGAGREQPAGG